MGIVKRIPKQFYKWDLALKKNLELKSEFQLQAVANLIFIDSVPAFGAQPNFQSVGIIKNSSA